MIEMGNWADYPMSSEVSAGNIETSCLGPVTNEQAGKEVAQSTGSSTAKEN